MEGRRTLWLALPIVVLVLALAPLYRFYDRVGESRAVVSHFTLESKLVGLSLRQTLVQPDGGGKGRPLLVLLHGYGADPDSWLSSAFRDAYESLGARAPDVLLVNGNRDSWYHDRASGRWGGYVLREAIPAALRRTGADPARIAIGGISMGGFGALDFAVHQPGRFCAAGGHSAAIWRTAAETPAGAFDDAEDFARNDVLGIAARSTRPFGKTRLWIDVGLADPFLVADRELAHILQAKQRLVAFHTFPGGHEGSYWDAHMQSYLRFYASALASCKRR